MREHVMTAAMMPDFNTEFFRYADQGVYAPISRVVSHLRQCRVCATHGLHDITCDIKNQHRKPWLDNPNLPV